MILKHKIYSDDYVAFLRRQAMARALAGLDLDALDSCGAGLGQTDEEIERTRREWEERAQRSELDHVDRMLRRQREGLDVLLARGGAVDSIESEPVASTEAERIAQGEAGPAPANKFTVYLVRVS